MKKIILQDGDKLVSLGRVIGANDYNSPIWVVEQKNSPLVYIFEGELKDFIVDFFCSSCNSNS